MLPINFVYQVLVVSVAVGISRSVRVHVPAVRVGIHVVARYVAIGICVHKRRRRRRGG